MCVQTEFRKWRSCEMMIIVHLRSFSTPSSQRIVSMSRLLVGSSSNMMSGSANKRLREQHAELPARRYRAHRAVVLLDRNADREQQLAGRGLGGVAVELCELALELGRAQAFCLGHRRLRIEALAFLENVPELLVAHDHRVDHGELFECELVLAQLADAHVRPDRHVAVRGLELAAEHFHERGLARAVRADQAVAMAVSELHGDVLEQRLLTELYGDVRRRNHGFISSRLGGLAAAASVRPGRQAGHSIRANAPADYGGRLARPLSRASGRTASALARRFSDEDGSSHHAVHTVSHRRHGGFAARQRRDCCLGRQQQASDGRGVLQGEAGHLGRVDDSHRDEIAVFLGRRVEAEVADTALHFVQHHGRISSAVADDLAQRLFDGAQQDP